MSDIQEKTAMVRILFEIVGLPKKGHFGKKSQFKVKKVDVFPLAFVFSDELSLDPVALINETVHKNPEVISDSIPTTDPGVYELVGEFYGKFSFEDNACLERLWQLSDVKAYQLSDEEIELLPYSLREQIEYKI